MRRLSKFSPIVATALGALVIGCGGAADEPEMDHAQVRLASKADSAEIVIAAGPGGYEVVQLYGAPAADLWSVMEKSGGFRAYRRGALRYLVGSYAICVSNGQAAGCHIYSRQVEQGGGFEAKLHGRRFASAASELFGALAYATGTSPASVREVRSDHFVCAKDRSAVWCGIHAAPTPRMTALSVSFKGLPMLGEGHVYEGWLITADGPVSAGRFTDPSRAEVRVDQAVAAAATLYVLTIEPAIGDDPAPSATHVLAGEFTAGEATLSTAHGAALGSDFSAASGGFILETPTSAATSDYDQGIWFLDPAQGPGASLALPNLPEGWAYEGWVVVDGKPVSTGRFTATAGADKDGAGLAAGPGGAPPFPGQDFITPALSLLGAKAVISVEPDPDDGPGPFALKPLVGDIVDAGPGALQGLTNLSAASAISGVARLSVSAGN